MTTTPDILTQLTNLLPTGTFLAFKLFSSIVTNNGSCGPTGQVLTGTTVFLTRVRHLDFDGQLLRGQWQTTLRDSLSEGTVEPGFLQQRPGRCVGIDLRWRIQ